ncbi:hypothetical protein STTU_3235 [Streptomyces sp. Tu6071]|nr:hypothetical protein STTU_3235 [Streptomyces sp. Tu6071]
MLPRLCRLRPLLREGLSAPSSHPTDPTGRTFPPGPWLTVVVVRDRGDTEDVRLRGRSGPSARIGGGVEYFALRAGAPCGAGGIHDVRGDLCGVAGMGEHDEVRLPARVRSLLHPESRLPAPYPPCHAGRHRRGVRAQRRLDAGPVVGLRGARGGGPRALRAVRRGASALLEQSGHLLLQRAAGEGQGLLTLLGGGRPFLFAGAERGKEQGAGPQREHGSRAAPEQSASRPSPRPRPSGAGRSGPAGRGPSATRCFT